MNLQYVYKPAADESVDPEWIIVGFPHLSVQVSSFDGVTDYTIVEINEDEDVVWWMRQHGSFRTLEEAKPKIQELLS